MTRLLIPAALIAATALAACGGASHSTATHHDPLNPTRSAGAPSSNAPADPQTPTKVEYVVTGTAPDGVDLMYRVGSKNISGPGQINGNATKVPWQGSVTFSSATKFY